MAISLDLRTHRTWENWLGIALGLLIIISPWLTLPSAMTSSMQMFMINAVVAGLIIGFLSALELEAFQPWEEWASMVLGLWVAASPWVFGYSEFTALTASHVVLGLLVAALAAVERWQVRREPPATD